MKTLLALASLSLIAAAVAPQLDAWMVNCDGATGFNGIEVNVQGVESTDDDVFISSTGIPSHSIGPWMANPNTAGDQQHLFQIPRTPTVATNNLNTPLGPIGVFVNGVPMFNTKDGMQFNNNWHQNAVVAEAISFDNCQGHPTMNSTYHYHQVPQCLRTELGDSGIGHSPIIGYAFDGYPVYGPYGYSDPMDAGSAVERIESSYRMRSITDRTTRPDGSALPPPQYGPAISAQYPLGFYLEDFEYVNGLGDLDDYNGRTCVTPDYPAGTYAYFATVDTQGESAFPYILGPQYYGVPEAANFPQGTVTVPAAAVPHDDCLPATYCTAGTSANGCTATIAAMGTASASAASGFVLEATGVDGAKDGLFFFGTNGRQANAWGNGSSFQCVVPPVMRAGLIAGTGTTGQCDGVLGQDLNARWQQKPAQNPGAGALVQAQLWYRDPQNTSNQTTSLSNAVEVLVEP